MKRAIYAIVYLVCSIWTAGTTNAELEDYRGNESCKDYRHDLAFAVGWSALPPSWVVAPIVTGFYEHGWRLAPREDCGK